MPGLTDLWNNFRSRECFAQLTHWSGSSDWQFTPRADGAYARKARRSPIRMLGAPDHLRYRLPVLGSVPEAWLGR